MVYGTLRVANAQSAGQAANRQAVNPKENGDARMLEATSYGLSALGLILVAAFCLVWAEERAALQAKRSSSLVDESKMKPLRNAGAVAVNRSGIEYVGREEPTELVLSIQMTSPAQARRSGSDGNSLLRERGPQGVPHG